MPEPADALYGLDPAAFTAARDALAKALRAGGDRTGADQVKRLRRPPATVWALNQVARRNPFLVRDVIDAGAALRAATERAVAGDASAMRAAKSAERSAIDAAVTAAERYLEDAGHPAGATARQRLEATLHAAEVDDTVAARLTTGTLDRDRDAPGLGFELTDWPDLSPATTGAGRAQDVGTDDGAADGADGPGARGAGAGTAADQAIAEAGAATGTGPAGPADGDQALPPPTSRHAPPDDREPDDREPADREPADRQAPPASRHPPPDDGGSNAGRGRRAGADVADLEDQADRLAGRAARLSAEAEAADRRAADARAAADQAEAATAAARASADQAGAAAADARAAADQAGAAAAEASEALARAQADPG